MKARGVLLLAVGAMVVAGCNDPADEKPSGREGVEQVQDEMLDVVDDVVHDVAAATGIEFRSGTDSALICGNSLDPVGVHRTIEVYFKPPTSSVQDAADAAADELEDAGWDVERPPNPVVVIGERDEMTVRFEFGYAATNVSLRSSCVDAPRDVANEYQDKGFTDIKWS